MKIVTWTSLVLLATLMHAAEPLAQELFTRGASFDALGSSPGYQRAQFLPVDEAFSLTSNRVNDVLQLHWLIHKGYYLYKDRLSITSSGNQPSLSFPEGKLKNDEIFGEVEVYYDELVINLPLTQDLMGDNSNIIIGYQGCADAGLCYPPQKRSIQVGN